MVFLNTEKMHSHSDSKVSVSEKSGEGLYFKTLDGRVPFTCVANRMAKCTDHKQTACHKMKARSGKAPLLTPNTYLLFCWRWSAIVSPGVKCVLWYHAIQICTLAAGKGDLVPLVHCEGMFL